MKMFELLPRPLGSIFRKLTHLTCNSRDNVCMFHKSLPLMLIAFNIIEKLDAITFVRYSASWTGRMENP